jgi:hypothetical protein
LRVTHDAPVRGAVSDGTVCGLVQVNVKVRDDAALGRFWADALRWKSPAEPPVTNLEPVGVTTCGRQLWPTGKATSSAC